MTTRKILRVPALAALTAALAACAPEYDTRRVPAPQGTLGEEVFQVMCERVHWGESPRDLGFAAGRGPCTRGLGPTEPAPGVGPRAIALARMRGELVAGLDQSMPRALYTPLDRLLIDMLPLYGPDGTGRRNGDAGTWIINTPDGGTAVAEDLLPQTTRAVAQQLATMATDAAVLRALGRMSQREGYRPPESAIGLLRPILAYDRVDEVLDATLGLLRQATPTQPDGRAYPQFNQVLSVLRGEFQGAGPSTATVTGTTLDAATDLFFRTDPALARSDRPVLVVRRDAAGNAIPTAGAAAGLPTPFATFRGPAVPRDAQGRATAAGGYPWRYVDLNATVLAALARELPGLLGAPSHTELPALQLMSGMRPLIGPRAVATRDYGAPAGRVEYQRFSADASPLVDLVHATGAMLTHRDVDAVLNTAQALMSPEREALTARLVGAILAIDEASDRVPEARMDARSVIWDDVIDVVRRIAAEPGLLEDILNALADMQRPLPATGLWDSTCGGSVPTQNLARAFGNYAQNRDRVEPDWSGNWNAHVAVNLTQAVDRARPDTIDNRSVLQRLFHLIDDLNGAHLCNKPAAEIRVYYNLLGPRSIGVPGASNIDACRLVEVPDAAAFYVRSIAGNGRAILPLDIPGIAGTLANLARTIGISLDSTLDGLVQSQSGINGFNSQPTPYAIARLVFNPRPNEFLQHLMDTATVRNAGSPPPSPSPVDRQVRTLHPATIFAWEGYCFYDSIRPLALAFARHDRLNGRADPALAPGADPRTMDPRAIDVSNGSRLFTELLSAFHRHWATSAAGGYQSTVRCESCREGVNYSQMDGAVRYEPIVRAALDGDLMPALSSVTAELRTLDVGGGRTGLQAVASLTRALVDTRARAMDGMPAFATPLRYRTGTTGALWADGTTPVGGVNLFYLFADGFNAMDPRFAAEPERHAEWLAARSSMVDQFLATEGTGSTARFHNRAIPGVTRALVAWLRERVAAHRAAGDLDPWALGLSARLETVLRDAPFAAATDLSLALRDDPAARVAIGRLLTHMMDDTAPNARSASPQATTLSALADTLQVLRDDADVDPLLHSLAPAMTPRTGLVPQVLRFFDRARALDRDHALIGVLGHAVERPAAGNPLTPEPLTVIADAIADTNRERPGTHGPMSPQDVFYTFREVISFLTDNSRGMEQFYAIVQRRRLPQ
jgi:hypothetical protein